MIEYSVLASGSGGNSTLLYNGETSVIIDFGISAKRAREGFSELSVSSESLRGVFLTHFHPDHAGDGLRTFLKDSPTPVFVNRYSAKKNHSALVKLSIDASLVRFFNVDQEISVQGFRIKPIEAFHDSPGCVSYYITSGEKSVLLVTDTGYFSDEMVKYADMCDCLFLESDYDDAMLDEGDYAPWLKRRIRSENGHLSNDQAFCFLSKLRDKPERSVYLIHLSENTNTPERAEKICSACTVKNKFIKAIPHGGSASGGIS